MKTLKTLHHSLCLTTAELNLAFGVVVDSAFNISMSKPIISDESLKTKYADFREHKGRI